MHVIFIGSDTVRKGKACVRCALTHSASPWDTRPADLQEALRLNCAQCPELCMQVLRASEVLAQLPNTQSDSRCHTLLWDDQVADTVHDPTPLLSQGSTTECFTLTHTAYLVSCSFLLLPSLFLSNPPPFSFPKLLCLPLPLSTAATRGCQPHHFTSLSFNEILCTS